MGSVRLNALTAEHLDGLYRDLGRGKGTPSEKPLAPSTVGHVHATARAVRTRLVSFTVAGTPSPRASRRPSAPRWPSSTWRPSSGPQRGAPRGVVDRVVPDRPRPGEILGVKWQDFRPSDSGTDGELLIRRSWSATLTGAYMRETTKMGKGRSVALLPEAAAALKMHRSRYLEEPVRHAEV